MNIDEISEIVRERQFELGATEPIAWKGTASRLKRAADHLFEVYHGASVRSIDRLVKEVKEGNSPPPGTSNSRSLDGQELEDHLDGQLIGVYMFLMGYAIENLLKAILMVQHPEYFRATEKMTDIQSHNLASLSVRCRIVVSEEERKLLDRLAMYIDWAGKYPVPLLSTKMPPLKSDDEWIHLGEAFRGRDQQNAINSFWRRLLDELEAARSVS